VAAALEHFRIEELEMLFESWGCQPGYAGRLVRAYYATGSFPSQGVLVLPATLRERLHDSPTSAATSLERREVSSDGSTKLLIRLRDGLTVESVMIPDYAGRRVAGCISSQVGCAMACDFGATTDTGFQRNLSAGEMVAQFLALRREADASDRRLQSVDFMGMGEPLHNVEEVLEAVRRIADNRYGALGWRQVTISTVGIVPGIEKLTEAGLAFHLAVSLHATDDATRAKLLPTGKGDTIAEILSAAGVFQSRRGRPVTIRYCLLRGVNDSLEQARELAGLVAGKRMHVNLLTYNPTGTGLRGIDYDPATEGADAFLGVLRERGIVTHLGRSRGPDIDAACG